MNIFAYILLMLSSIYLFVAFGLYLVFSFKCLVIDTSLSGITLNFFCIQAGLPVLENEINCNQIVLLYLECT